jgi:hypothetical protein
MKQTAIQQAIVMVRSRMESIDETLMGKHTIHHLQQIERGLYELLEEEKNHIMMAYNDGYVNAIVKRSKNIIDYYEETYGEK